MSSKLAEDSELSAIGRWAEQSMLLTNGRSQYPSRGDLESWPACLRCCDGREALRMQWHTRLRQLAGLPDWSAPKQQSNGSRVIQR